MEQKFIKIRKGQYMDAILTILIFEKAGYIGFNKLERNLREKAGLKMSKPTLSKYLKELEEKDIIKKDGDAWNAKYILNEELWRKDINIFNNEIEKWVKIINKQKENFESIGIGEQFSNIVSEILWREFKILEILINPNNKEFDKLKLYYYESSLFKPLEDLMIIKSRSDEKYKNDVINGIDLFIKQLDDERISII